MMEEFIDFVDSICPSIPPDIKEKAKFAIRDFKNMRGSVNYLMSSPLDKLSQGDILSKVPFMYYDSNGEEKRFIALGMVITTSCDIDNDNRLTVVPVLPLEQYPGNESTIKNNQTLSYMYIPDIKMENYFIDFALMNTYDKNLIFQGIESNRISRYASLSQVGFYFFITKLTVFLMRKEDYDTQGLRKAM